MKVLLVMSGNCNEIPVFISDQEKDINKRNVQTDRFQIKGKGVLGYLKNYRKLKKKQKNTLRTLFMLIMD